MSNFKCHAVSMLFKSPKSDLFRDTRQSLNCKLLLKKKSCISVTNNDMTQNHHTIHKGRMRIQQKLAKAILKFSRILSNSVIICLAVGALDGIIQISKALGIPASPALLPAACMTSLSWPDAVYNCSFPRGSSHGSGISNILGSPSCSDLSRPGRAEALWSCHILADLGSSLELGCRPRVTLILESFMSVRSVWH